ncbi:uncharacterized protein LOC122508701 [Leptopilina heterotoma]|uniref:uncharacterized protein LOC122508701 n=1 Tax=Leptopilina heterotoma TaxID=63436 RepID=UPI001CA9876C|nr:uncharacterized protein LOC122508701 [Leptopilina heterotoma]
MANSRKFKIIKFLCEEEGIADCDIVPAKWIEYDPVSGSLVTHFPNGPYTAKKSKVIHSLVKNCKDPLADWPVFEISLKGEADTYEVAEKRLVNLREKEYGFTTDTTENHIEKAKQLTDSYRLAKEKNLTKKEINEILKVTDFNKEFEKNDNSDSYSEELESSPDEIVSSSESISEQKKKDSKKIKKRTNIYKHSDKRKFKSSAHAKSKSTTKVDQLNLPTSLESSKTKHLVPTEMTAEIKDNSLDLAGPSNISLSKTSIAANIPEQSHLSKPIEQPDTSRTYNMETPQPFQNAEILDLGNLVHTNNSSELILLNSFAQTNNRLENSDQKILNLLQAQTHEIKELKLEIANMRNLFEAFLRSQKLETRSLSDEFKIELPVKDEESLQKVEKLLITNDTFKNHFEQSLYFHLDKENVLSRSITNVLKKILSRDIAMSFTASKLTEGKKIFRGTPICKCLLDVLTSHCKTKSVEFSEKVFYQKLGLVLSNSKDWDGFRQQRKKTVAEPDQAEQEIAE